MILKDLRKKLSGYCLMTVFYILKKYLKSDFDGAKQHTKEGVEFWYARDLKDILEYEQCIIS